MPIRFACPKCKTVYTVQDADAGKKSDCTNCGQRLEVQTPPAPPPRPKTVLGDYIPPGVEPPKQIQSEGSLPIKFDSPIIEPRTQEPQPEPERERFSRSRGNPRRRDAELYNNEESTRFYSSLSRANLEGMIEDIVGRLGNVRFYRVGTFEVSAGRFNSFATQVEILGQLSEGRDEDEWNLRLSYTVKPTGACIAIAVVGFIFILIGPLIFLMPYMAKSEVQRAVDRAVRDVRDEAEGRRGRSRRD